jgi:hypothetical protein
MIEYFDHLHAAHIFDDGSIGARQGVVVFLHGLLAAFGPAHAYLYDLCDRQWHERGQGKTPVMMNRKTMVMSGMANAVVKSGM